MKGYSPSVLSSISAFFESYSCSFRCLWRDHVWFKTLFWSIFTVSWMSSVFIFYAKPGYTGGVELSEAIGPLCILVAVVPAMLVPFIVYFLWMILLVLRMVLEFIPHPRFR